MTDLQLPDNVYSVTTEQALDLLGMSRSTLGDYKRCLNGNSPKGWNYISMQRGFTISQLKILWVLKRLVCDLGRRSAEQNLQQALREFNDNG